MNWFKRLSTANKIAVISVFISMIGLFIGFIPSENEKDSVKQSTAGNESPIINASGSSTVTITGGNTK